MKTEKRFNLIDFVKAGPQHEEIIFQWLAEPHFQEFWDNSQEHKDDITNFLLGRKQYYFYGTTKYWIGLFDQQPYSFILTDQIQSTDLGLPEVYREHLSKSGHTIGLDFGIGNKDFLGIGLAAPTIVKFTLFYQDQIDPLADTFYIDPDANNSRAKHVYEKAGFHLVGGYNPTMGAFIGQDSHLLVKTL